MIEFNLITSIISHLYEAKSQSEMVEEKLKVPHKVSILGSGVDEYKLYRFDPDSDDFMPFFERGYTAKSGVKIDPPEDLRKFCDYVLVATSSKKLYVILVEMKSGDPDGARSQLDAAEEFVSYIIRTAERIKDINDFSEFDPEKIVIRKVILKAAKSSKLPTNVASSGVNWHDPHIIFKSKEFPINRFCRLR